MKMQSADYHKVRSFFVRIPIKRLFLSLLILALSSVCLSPKFAVLITGDPHNTRPGSHFHTITVQDYDRTFILYQPDCDIAVKPLPLVFMFHGGGGTAKGVKRDTGWTELADEYCFLVVFPDGLPQDPQREPSFTRNPQLWNDGSGRFNLDIDDIQFVEMILDVLHSQYNIDPLQVYATGFSNGASMAFRIGIELQNNFSAIAPVSGALWYEDFTLSSPVSLLYMTGTADPLNPMEGGVPRLSTGDGEPGGEKAKPPVEEHILTWSGALGCDPQPMVLVDEGILKAEIYRGCESDSEVQYYTLEGIGHHWPGGKIRLPESLVGQGTDEIQATEIIWDFFRSHPKP